jgi:hypothetical protein
MPRLVFLLLLLSVDWYFDTSFGTSPFDRPMSSTEAFCKALAYKQDIQQELSRPEMRCPAQMAILVAPPVLSSLLDFESLDSIPPDADPVFDFTSMLC